MVVVVEIVESIEKLAEVDTDPINPAIVSASQSLIAGGSAR